MSTSIAPEPLITSQPESIASPHPLSSLTTYSPKRLLTTSALNILPAFPSEQSIVISATASSSSTALPSHPFATAVPEATTTTQAPQAPPTLDKISLILMILGILLLVFGLSLVASVAFCRKPWRRQYVERPIREQDINEFYNGAKKSSEEPDYIHLPYKRDLEIPKTVFTIGAV